MPHSHYDDSADDKLILRLQRGDTSAFEPLIDRHLRHVRMFAALKSPATEVIEDIVRDTFVIAFQNIADFSVGMSFRTWLRGIAWDLVRTEIKRRRSAAEASSRYTQNRLAELERETGSVHEVDEVEALEEGIDGLPASLREILALRYARNLSNELICSQTRRKLVWVRTALFRVRQQLSNRITSKTGRRSDAE